MKRTLCSTSLIGLALLGACMKKPVVDAGAAKVAVRIGDEIITVAELDKRIAGDLFELRSQAMHAVLIDRLLRREGGERRGVDLVRLHEQEVDSKVPTPTPAEAAAALSQWVDGGRLTPAEATHMTPALAAERLRSMRLGQAEEAFYDRLMKQAAVQIDFNALGKPDLQLPQTGPRWDQPRRRSRIRRVRGSVAVVHVTVAADAKQLVTRYAGRVQFRFKQKASAPDSDGARLAKPRSAPTTKATTGSSARRCSRPEQARRRGHAHRRRHCEAGRPCVRALRRLGREEGDGCPERDGGGPQPPAGRPGVVDQRHHPVRRAGFGDGRAAP